MLNINKDIFRAYDVRGQEQKGELTTELFELLGRAYGSHCLRENIAQTIVVGYDSRESSHKFAKTLIQGLVSTGCEVIDLGMVVTPMMYWAQHYFNTKGGVMITASHNPVGWNGAKFASGLSQTLGGDNLKKLYTIIQDNDFLEQTGGTVREHNILDEHIQDLATKARVVQKQKVLVNTGNGTAGLVVSKILKAAGCEVVELHTEIDSSYPHYMPNPIAQEMIQDTEQAVQNNNVDFALMFDGDGDRVGLVDGDGRTISPDYFFIFLLRRVLQEKPGATIVYDVSCTQAIQDEIDRLGGKGVMCAVGHTNVKDAIKKHNAALGGESSGHIAFAHGYYGFDDGVFTGLKLAEYFSDYKESVSDLEKQLPHYVTSPRWSFSASEKEKFEIVQKVADALKQQGYDTQTLDGVRVQFENGFGLMRASNTSGSIVMRFEAKTQEQLQEIENIFKQHLQNIGGVAENWEIG